MPVMLTAATLPLGISAFALSQSDYIIYHLTEGNTNPKLRDVAKKLYESSPKGT